MTGAATAATTALTGAAAAATTALTEAAMAATTAPPQTDAPRPSAGSPRRRASPARRVRARAPTRQRLAHPRMRRCGGQQRFAVPRYERHIARRLALAGRRERSGHPSCAAFADGSYRLCADRGRSNTRARLEEIARLTVFAPARYVDAFRCCRAL